MHVEPPTVKDAREPPSSCCVSFQETFLTASDDQQSLAKWGILPRRGIVEAPFLWPLPFMLWPLDLPFPLQSFPLFSLHFALRRRLSSFGVSHSFLLPAVRVTLLIRITVFRSSDGIEKFYTRALTVEPFVDLQVRAIYEILADVDRRCIGWLIQVVVGLDNAMDNSNDWRTALQDDSGQDDQQK